MYMINNFNDKLSKYRAIARQYSLRPDFLDDILRLSLQGYNKSEIANQVGITRPTVHKYLKVVREEMTDEDLHKVLVGVVALFGGPNLS